MQTLPEGRPCEDTGGRWPSARPGERPQGEPALPAPGSQPPSCRAGRKKCLLWRPWGFAPVAFMEMLPPKHFYFP